MRGFGTENTRGQGPSLVAHQRGSRFNTERRGPVFISPR